jgi:two-component system response regulator MprA
MARPVDPPPPARILVVDDEPHIRAVLYEALRDEGYAVSVAGDGFDAIRELREHPVDLILLDLMMPAMDGRRFLDIYRQSPGPKVPVVIVTAARAGGVEIEHELGAAVVHKPFSIDRLLALVRRHLEYV